jgi:pimeloyl-ACP methyl ester carboxylesterase
MTILAAGVVAVLLLTLVWGLQRRFVYFPDSSPVPSAETVIPGARDMELHTEDGLTLGAWLVPPRSGDRDLTVLVANGNGGDRSLRAPLARALAEEGMDVLLFDYRGYGGNPGTPTEEGLARDVRAARALLVESGVPADRILYFGESLGTAVVTELATEHPPAGMLLRSPFEDLGSLGRVHYPFLPVRSLLRDRYPLVEQLRGIEVPVTVVYGTRDSIVPPEQSRTVAEATPNLLRLVAVEGAAHNDRALLDSADLVAAVVDLADHVAPPD